MAIPTGTLGDVNGHDRQLGSAQVTSPDGEKNPLDQDLWHYLRLHSLIVRFALLVVVSIIGSVANLTQLFPTIKQCHIRLTLVLLTGIGGLGILGFSFLKARRTQYRDWDRVLTLGFVLVVTGLLVFITYSTCCGNQCPKVTLNISSRLVVVGSTVDLRAEADDPEGDELAYWWSANDLTSGIAVSGLEANGGPYTTADNKFTASPALVGWSVRITVKVDDGACGGMVEKTKELQVCQLPTPTSMSTVTSTPSSTPTDMPTATVTPSLMPADTPMSTDTPSPTPTDTPMPTDTLSPTPTDTPTTTCTPSRTLPPRPTATFTPSCTLTPYPPPTLIGAEVNGCNVILNWSWPGTLAEDEWFAVRVGIEAPHSVVWVKDCKFTHSLKDGGEYCWEIAICKGDPAKHSCSKATGEELVVSERRTFSFPGCGPVRP